MNPKLKVLIVEDNPADARFVRLLLTQGSGEAQFDLQQTDRLSTALEAISGVQPDVILLDLSLPDSKGIDTIIQMLKSTPGTPIVILTGLDDEILAIQSIQLGAQDYLSKNQLDEHHLTRTIRYAIERKQSEEQLRQSEERYRLLFDNNPQPMWVYDVQNYRFLSVNQATIKHYGYSCDEFMAMTILDIRPAEEIGRLRENLLEQREVVQKSGPWKHRKKDGTLMDVEIISHDFTFQNQPARLVLANDITQRLHAELALQESEARYRAVFENSLDAILITSPDGTIHYANRSACEMFGRTQDDLRKVRRQGIVDASDPRLPVLLEERRRRGRMRGDLTFIRSDGTKFEGEITSEIFLDKDGLEKTSMIIRDITERKRAELALEESEKHYRLLADNSSDMISRLTLDGKYIYISPASRTILGYEPEELIEHHSAELIHPEELENLATKIETIEDLVKTRTITARTRHKEGHYVWLEASSHLIFDEAGSPTEIHVSARNITERKQAEIALRESEHEFRILAESMPQIVWITRSDGWNIYFNQQWVDYTGLSLEESYGNGWNKPFHPDDQQRAWDAWQNAVKNNALYSLECRLRRADGVYKWWLIRGVPVMDAQGTILKWFGTCTDIHELKQSDAKIRMQLERLNALREIDRAITSTFDMRLSLDVLLFQAANLLNVDAARVLLLNGALNSLECVAGIGFYTKAAETYKSNLNGSHTGQAALEQRLVHISDLSNGADIPFPGDFLTEEKFVSYHAMPLIVKAKVIGVLEIFKRAPQEHDQEWFDFLETLAGQAALAIDNAQLFEDLERANTELEQRVAMRTEELNQANIKLERANRAKDEFLANMSHELRTPLNSVLGLSETLLEQRRDPLSEYQQKSLQIIQSSGSHLLELINDILDLSKIEAGKFDFYPQIVDVNTLCRASLAFVTEQAMRKSIALTYEEDEAVSKIYADPRRLKQILVNLLTNAVKFTPDNGQVILQVRGDEEHDRIQLSVIDNGIGIALEELKQLFVPFRQVDSSLTRDYEGTGLGLALVQKLTDIHGGSVDVESEVGNGSRFTINLPIGQTVIAQQEILQSGSQSLGSEQTTQSNTPAPEPAGRGVILLAEDNMANILTIGDYLEIHGYQIVVAHNGLEALEKAAESRPNVILMDIQMPALDGLEAIRRLRAVSRFASLPIIALTALAMPGDRERCLEAGANEYMSKPVSLKTLRQTIESMLQGRSRH